MKQIVKRLTSNSRHPSQPLSLKRNFSWTFLGNVIQGACQWLFLSAFVKLGTPEMVGQYTLGLAIVTPIFLLTNLQLRALQATDAKQEYCFNDYLKSRLTTTTIALSIVLTVILLGHSQKQTGIAILLIGIAKAIESISDIIYGFLQQHEQMHNIAQSTILKNLISLGLLVVTLYLTRNLGIALIALVLGAIATLLLYDIPQILPLLRVGTENRSPVIFNAQDTWKVTRDLIWASLPVGLISMMGSLSINFPRYFIEIHLGQRELGIFSAIAYLPVAGVILINALGHSALPRLAKHHAVSDRKAFQKLVLQLLAFAAGIGAMGILAVALIGKQLLSIIYQPEYAQQSHLLTWLMVWGGIHYAASYMGYAVTATRCFRSTFIFVTLGTLFSYSLNSWLIPRQGLQGAVSALLINELVQLIGMSLILVFTLSRTKQRVM